MEEFLQILELLTSTPVGILLIILVGGFVFGMIWLAGGGRRQTSVLVDVLAQLSHNNTEQIKTTADMNKVLEAVREMLDKTYEQHVTAHNRVDEEHALMQETVDRVTLRFSEGVQAVIAAVAEAEDRIVQVIMEHDSDECVSAVQDLLAAVTERIELMAEERNQVDQE